MSSTAEASTSGRGTASGWLAAFACAAVLYGATANRGIQWQDSGYHILRVVTGEALNPLGLALSHPLHHWLGRFAAWLRFAEPCFAVTLVSAIAGAVAVANVYGCVVFATRSVLTAALSAAAFALAHTVWQMSTVAETYTLAAALLTGETWFLVAFLRSGKPRHLCGAFLLNGLGVANHLLAVLSAPILLVVLIAAIVRRSIGAGLVGAAAVLWLLGASPYIAMIAGEWMRSADALGTLRSALFGNDYSTAVLNTTLSGRRLLISLGFVVVNFPNIILLAAFYAAVPWRGDKALRKMRAVLAGGMLLHAVFVLRYPITDQQTFFVPMYSYLAILGGIGLADYGKLRPMRRRVVVVAAGVMLACTPLLYAALPGLARRMNVLSGVERHRPYRDDYVYVFTPWSIIERSAERMSREAVQLAGEGGLIAVGHGRTEYPVRYQALRSGRNIEVVPMPLSESVRDRLASGRKVVLVPADVTAPPSAPSGTEWQKTGDLYVLRRLAPHPSP